jgi:gluconate 2-dehydrogenase gamma chain
MLWEIAALGGVSGWRILLQAAQDFTTHVHMGLLHVLHAVQHPNPALPGKPKSSMLPSKSVFRVDVRYLGGREGTMTSQELDRRDFLKGAVVGAAAAGGAAAIATPETALAQQPAAPAAEPAGYAFLNLDEAAFVEALVDHMIPADEVSPKGTDLGVNIYIDRALAGAWGKGERLYMQGPWKQGTPSQGYQLPLTPAQLYRAGIEATNAHCRKVYGKAFDRIEDAQRQEVLIGLSSGKITFDNGLPVRAFWATLYQTVIEGMYSDPIYGGNRNKAGWAIIGFPGVIAVHRDHVEQYRGKPFPNKPLGISDMS